MHNLGRFRKDNIESSDVFIPYDFDLALRPLGRSPENFAARTHPLIRAAYFKELRKNLKIYSTEKAYQKTEDEVANSIRISKENQTQVISLLGSWQTGVSNFNAYLQILEDEIRFKRAH